MKTALFDTWTDKYDRWFTTPTGRLVKQYELALLLELLQPRPGEHILDVGCGTGIFTQDVLAHGATVTGIDLSVPMLAKALSRADSAPFAGLCADMCSLPFADNRFDKVFSMTAIDFVADGSRAVAEFERVTRPGGTLVVTTLNSLSPWAEERKRKAQHDGHALFEHIYFRSPDELRGLISVPCTIRTAIHFRKTDPVEEILKIEQEGEERHLESGALLAVQWWKT